MRIVALIQSQGLAQAVEVAGSLNLGFAITAMHSRQFDIGLGRIGVDASAGVTGFEPLA
jgi:hypothetical protein